LAYCPQARAIRRTTAAARAALIAFLFVLPKALEVSGDVRALGSELLAAYEKGDAELLATCVRRTSGNC